MMEGEFNPVGSCGKHRSVCWRFKGRVSQFNGSFGLKNGKKTPKKNSFLGLEIWHFFFGDIIQHNAAAVKLPNNPTIFQPYIISNGTYERIKKNSDTLPLREYVARWYETKYMKKSILMQSCIKQLTT